MKNPASDVQVRTTPEIKLKSDPPERRFQFIHLEKVFGFVPETIVIELGSGNNKFKISAIVPEEIKKKIEEEEKREKAHLAKLAKHSSKK